MRPNFELTRHFNPMACVGFDQNYDFRNFFLTEIPNQMHLPAHPAPVQRGASADRHETWARDAMDATVPSAFQALNDRRMLRTGKPRGPGTPGLVLSLAEMIREATVTKRSWTPGRARSKP